MESTVLSSLSITVNEENYTELASSITFLNGSTTYYEYDENLNRIGD